MKKEIISTADGSHTLSIPEMDVTYHSRHGALQESMHVFIEAGWRYLVHQQAIPSVNLFEMGFGTGLNAFLTAMEAESHQRNVHYTAVEPYPLSTGEAGLLNYSQLLGHEELFLSLHRSSWNEDVKISDYFTLRKVHNDLSRFSAGRLFDLVYYDAFAPAAQPELWTVEIFQRLFAMLGSPGILVTYCAKGAVRRAMTAAGFTVTRLTGPKGKREMLRAVK